MAENHFGKDTRMAMAPIKKKKRLYYTIVFLIVAGLVGTFVGLKVYGDYTAEKGFKDAVALMEEGLQQGDYISLNRAEQAIREEAKRENPRAEAIAYSIMLRSLIWFTYTGEAVLMSDCRKYLDFLEDPEGMYSEDPSVPMARAVYEAVGSDANLDNTKAAQQALQGLPEGAMLAGQKEFWLGISHWAAGEWVPAAAEMSRAVEKADTPLHHYGLARVLDLGGKKEEAIAEYRKVLQANPALHAAEAYLLLAELTPEDDVVAKVEAFFDRYKGQVEARIASDLTIAAANAIALGGDPDLARKKIQQAKINDPGYRPLLKWTPPEPPAEDGEGAE